MGRIILLDENTANQIAAGEVVERPASVIKELVENSIDAGADKIAIEIRNGGIKFIKITDNGTGIEDDDIEIAFERHSTSKIKGSKDLTRINTLGFRGEALASIASVSKITVITKTKGSKTARKATVLSGEVTEITNTGARDGTAFIIEDLFYNTPARFKFLKKDMTEARYVSDSVIRLALGNPGISIKFINNSKTVLNTPGDGRLESAIYSIYGREIAGDIINVAHEGEKISINGSIGREFIAKSSRSYQSIYVNGRYIKNATIAAALDQAYKTYLMKNKFPFAVLKIEINPQLVDVNVHPAKTEIRFSDEKMVFRETFSAVINALERGRNYKNIELEKPEIAEKISYKPNNNTIQNKNDKMQTFKTSETITEYIKQQSIDIADKLKEKNFENTFRNKSSNPKTESRANTETTLLNKQNEPSEGIDENELLESKYIGQVFDTYLLLQNNEELIFIDQHAAHERIIFERLKKRHESKENLSQQLLKPLVIPLNISEYNTYREYESILNELGFETEEFGEQSMMIRGIPIDYDTISSNTFKDILTELEAKNRNNAIERVYTAACKAAIKANAKLSEVETEELIKELSKCKNPYHCPHGRPTAFKITMTEIEKKFKRRL